MICELGSISSSKQRDAPVLYLQLMDVCILVVMCHSFYKMLLSVGTGKGHIGSLLFIKTACSSSYLKFNLKKCSDLEDLGSFFAKATELI